MNHNTDLKWPGSHNLYLLAKQHIYTINSWLSSHALKWYVSHTCVVVVQDVDKKLWLGAEGNVKLHLVKLLEEQKVSRIEGEDGEIRWSLTLEHKL